MRMIPPVIAKSTRSAAERKLFKDLRDLPAAKDSCCLHSVNLPDHQYKILGEIDFVIAAERGLYVLEVKGGRINCTDGIWSYQNRYGEIHRSSEGPFHQARSGMFALRNRLLRTIPERELGQMVMGYGVVFPDCDFAEPGVEWPLEIVLDARRLRREGLHSYIQALETYWHRKLQSAPQRVEPKLVARVVKAIRPDFDLVPALQARADEVEGRLVELTEQQYAVIDAIDGNDRILVEGGAGTGKTFLAIETARRQAGEGRRVLFVCFSPVLAKFLRSRVDSSAVQVESVHGLMLGVTRKYGAIPSGYSPAIGVTDPWFADELIPAFLAASRTLPEAERCDVLVVDEAQDLLSIEYLSALGSMLRGGLERGMWRVFYDRFNQGALLGIFDPDALEILQGLSPARAQLRKNCRNTDQIVLQTKLVTGADLGNSSTGPGPAVHYETFEDGDGATRLLEKQLDDLRKQEIDEQDITILSPLPFSQSSAARLGKRWRSRITVLDRPDGLRLPFQGLTWATIADFKGLENRYILLTDIEDIDSTPGALAALYVGMTRARVALWVDTAAETRKRIDEVSRLHLPAVVEEIERAR